ncbi:glycosyl hydrolase family 18 protein [Deinococcus roseus]|uniref:Chitinase n=1 Tax=Deinococcus roseus TaxID=392414 RepID=A0ABQ2CY82_9DEIO|nr:glycosyl hydrolase family 18 protein [Deinococcus roseus]GGJ32670.1 hypothetical protein GCM10008938_18640 [Deinococcus roseus]
MSQSIKTRWICATLTGMLLLASCGQKTPPVQQTPKLTLQTQSVSSPIKVSFELHQSWYGGFIGKVKLQNLTAQPVSGWQVEFKMDGGATAKNPVWGAAGNLQTQADGSYLLTPNTWGGASIPAGSTIEAFFMGDGVFSTVSGCLINRLSCTPAADTENPTVTVSSNTSHLTRAGSVKITASAQDNVGISKVAFFRNGVKVAEDSNAPYEHLDGFNTSAQNGTYQYSATAYDGSGNQGSSETTSVQVEIPTGGPVPTTRTFVGYFPAWVAVENFHPDRIPSFYTHLVLSFGAPDMTYVHGSENVRQAGLMFWSWYGGNDRISQTLKQNIQLLQARGQKVMLAVGGATAGLGQWSAFNVNSLKAFVEDYNLDGVDVDLELFDQCHGTIQTEFSCNNNYDLLTASVINQIKGAMPDRIVSIAAGSVGAYTPGGPYGNEPGWQEMKGFSHRIFQQAGHNIDLINIMAYDARSALQPTHTFDAYKHYRDIGWTSASISLGLEVPKEGWGGGTLGMNQSDVTRLQGIKPASLGEELVNLAPHYNVQDITQHMLDHSNPGDGMMLWHVIKTDPYAELTDAEKQNTDLVNFLKQTPTASTIATKVCQMLYATSNCTETYNAHVPHW